MNATGSRHLLDHFGGRIVFKHAHDLVLAHDAHGNAQEHARKQYPEQELREGHQGHADDLAKHQFGSLDGRHEDLHHTGALFFDHGAHDHAGEEGDEHIDGHTQNHGQGHVDAALGNALVAALVNGVTAQMHVGLDARHDFFQVLDAVTLDAIGLHGIVDAVFDHLPGIHAEGLLGVAVGLDGPGHGVQFGDAQEHVHARRAEVRLDGVGVCIGPQVLEDGDIVVREVRQHDAGTVDDTYLLGLLLGAQHNQGRQDGNARKEHRGQESDEKEALFLNLVKILALDNNS